MRDEIFLASPLTDRVLRFVLSLSRSLFLDSERWCGKKGGKKETYSLPLSFLHSFLFPLPPLSPRFESHFVGTGTTNARGSLRARSGAGPSQVENSGGAAWRIDPFAWNHRALFSISLLGGEKIPGLEFFSGMEGARIRRRINGGRIYLGLDDGLWRWRPRSNVRCSPIGSRPVNLREAHANLFFKLYFHDFSCNEKRKNQIFNFNLFYFRNRYVINIGKKSIESKWMIEGNEIKKG